MKGLEFGLVGFWGLERVQSLLGRKERSKEPDFWRKQNFSPCGYFHLPLVVCGTDSTIDYVDLTDKSYYAALREYR